MGLRPTPSQRQKRLGQELQRLREPSGLSAAEAGARIGVGRAHMSHIEAARTYISGEKVRILAKAYGCTRQTLIDELVALAESRGRGWWSEYQGLVSSELLDLAELEAMAVRIRTFQWHCVPGLLQTPEYTRDLFRGYAAEMAPEELERYAEFRQRRQHVLSREDPLTFHAIVHEAAFHMGFIDPGVMIDQLEFLIEAARSPNVVIQLVPFSAPTNPSARGAFSIYDMRSPELRTVQVEHPGVTMTVTEQGQLRQFAARFGHLGKMALAPLMPEGRPGEGSLGLVQYLLYSLKKETRARDRMAEVQFQR